MDRWRKPVRVAAIEPSGNRVRIGDREYADYDVTAPAEDIARMRHGYVCPHCMEPFETPFPEACCVCGLAGRDMPEWFAATYGGEKWIGPRESLSDELERLKEEDDRKSFRKEAHIWLPRGVR